MACRGTPLWGRSIRVGQKEGGRSCGPGQEARAGSPWVGEGGSLGGSGASEGLAPRYRFQVPWLESVPIAVSNNIDEGELARLVQEVGWGGVGWGGAAGGGEGCSRGCCLSSPSCPLLQGSEVNVIGIGASVVTCPRQPSLGCVYKVETGRPVGVRAGVPRAQLSQHPVTAAGVRGRPTTNEAD